MSIFNRSATDSPLAKVVQEFKTLYREQGAAFASQEHTRQLVSLESLNEAQFAELERHSMNIMDQIRAAFNEAIEGVSLENFQLQAGAIAALAAGDPETYHRSATNVSVSQDGVTVIHPEPVGRHGSLNYLDRPALESFDNQELARHIPYSIAFNVQASRQDAFGEAFYPTVVVPPDQAGLDIAVQRTLVMEEVRHQSSGKTVGWERKNLLDAVVNHEILANNATKVVPVVLADDSNADKFVDASLVAPKEIVVNRVPVRTAPLRMGVDVDLLGISTHQGLIGAGLMDSTDSLDARIGLDRIYMTATAKVAGDDVTEVFSFAVSRMPRADFVKSVEGDHREMNLAFSTKDLILDGELRTVSGAESQILETLRTNNYSVRLKVNINGVVNLETAHTNVYASPVELVALYETDPNSGEVTELPLTGPEAATVREALGQLTMVGYTLNATRSNQNLRTRGLLLNINKYVERYTIPMGSPISVPAPISSDRSASDLTSLINAARIYTSNNAVTSLLNYAETLKEYVNNLPLYGEDGLAIEGIGRFLVKPFFEELDLDLTKELNSISSHERNFDVKALIVDAIREISYRMYRDSNYQAALDALTGTAGQKPRLIIGTDPTIENHLQVIGDTRTAGIAFDHEIVSTTDRRMRGKIVFSFARPNAGGADPLTFGCHAWVPELTSTVQLTRQGATVKETTVQPRSRHINILPVMGVINVTGLEVLRQKTSSLVVNP